MPVSEHERALREIHALLQELQAAVELDLVLRRLTTAATNLTDSQAGSILKFDPEANCLRFISAPWFHEPLKQVAIPVAGSMAGWAFSNRETLVVQDVATDARHFTAVDLAMNFQTSTLLAVPLVFQGEAIGVLEVINKNNHAHYTGVDITILELLAGYVVLVLHAQAPRQGMQAGLEEVMELNRIRKNIIAITSHELRTPLGLILGHATFLREMIDEQFREPLEVIVNNAVRLKEIVEDLTDVDNYESGLARVRKRRVAMSALLEGVIASFEEMASSKNVTLRFDPAGEALVEVDENKLTIALNNLLRNAITFTDSGGEVRVGLQALPGCARISVQDTGIGIPAKDLQNVFERFYQIESHLTRRHGGMGLGLSVAKAMVEMHTGRIWVESAVGQGSTFFIEIPRPEPD